MKHKISTLTGGEWVPAEHPLRYVRQQGRIFASLPNHASELIHTLLDVLPPPFYVLYILHTPRGEAEPGRYQSSALDAVQVRDFIRKYSDYLCADSRMDIWFHSPTGQATLVWDRHNMLYGYGPQNQLIETLERQEYEPGPVNIPAPHAHNYWPECDAVAGELLQGMDWHWSPLQPVDEQ